jgi:hypothetical protein
VANPANCREIARDASLEIEPLLNALAELADELPALHSDPEALMQRSVMIKALVIRSRALNDAVMTLLTDSQVSAASALELRKVVDHG